MVMYVLVKHPRCSGGISRNNLKRWLFNYATGWLPVALMVMCDAAFFSTAARQIPLSTPVFTVMNYAVTKSTALIGANCNKNKIYFQQIVEISFIYSEWFMIGLCSFSLTKVLLRHALRGCLMSQRPLNSNSSPVQFVSSFLLAVTA